MRKQQVLYSLLGCLILLFGSNVGYSQTTPLSTPAAKSQKARLSPLAGIKHKVGDADISIEFGSPAVKGRKIWGELIPFNKVWRTGANEATTFEVNQDIKVEGQTLPAGRYSLFTIPGESEWTLIFNSVPDQWGAFNYDSSKDVLRVTVKPQPHEELVERMTIEISDSGSAVIIWEHLEVPFKIETEG